MELRLHAGCRPDRVRGTAGPGPPRGPRWSSHADPVHGVMSSVFRVGVPSTKEGAAMQSFLATQPDWNWLPKGNQISARPGEALQARPSLGS